MFTDILDYLRDDDIMVFNDTRVVATRLYGSKDSGANVEALLMKRISSGVWEAMVKPGRRVPVGTKLSFDPGLRADTVNAASQTLTLSGAIDATGHAISKSGAGVVELPGAAQSLRIYDDHTLLTRQITVWPSGQVAPI
jgi:S-adenosylmethionine:tRNA-ribosyltransferase-isomerase (queuine synthetase)